MQLYEYKSRHKTFFLEFWDVGGSKKYQPSRELFYTQINGRLTFDGHH